MMSADRALADAIAFCQGVGDKDPAKVAAYVIEQLALRGFTVQAMSAPILNDLTPETLRRVRKALGLTLSQLATETGLGVQTVRMAERGGRQAQAGTLKALRDTLVRHGARLPEHVDHVQAMNHHAPEGALSGLGLDDKEGTMIRAALDLVGLSRDPPVAGVAAIRAALKDYLIGVGRWPAAEPGEDE